MFGRAHKVTCVFHVCYCSRNFYLHLHQQKSKGDPWDLYEEFPHVSCILPSMPMENRPLREAERHFQLKIASKVEHFVVHELPFSEGKLGGLLDIQCFAVLWTVITGWKRKAELYNVNHGLINSQASGWLIGGTIFVLDYDYWRSTPLINKPWFINPGLTLGDSQLATGVISSHGTMMSHGHNCGLVGVRNIWTGTWWTEPRFLGGSSRLSKRSRASGKPLAPWGCS